MELEQEIEKAKTEENYIRDRLALSLKVIFLLALWPGPMLAVHIEHVSSLRAQVCIGLNPRTLPGHGLDMVVVLLAFGLKEAPGLMRRACSSQQPLALRTGWDVADILNPRAAP